VADVDSIVNGACNEIVIRGADRQRWLVFCTGVRHAEHVCDALRGRGIAAEMVLGETPQEERERIIAEFKAGDVRCLVNVMVLTTGFDVPQVDLIAMLRPTLSTGLYVQMIGRGSRKAANKTDCLVLDFAGNVRRHGPVDCISLDDIKTQAVNPDDERCRVCPQCDEINPIGALKCISCGYEWPRSQPEPKHATVADTVPVLGSELTWLAVDSVSFHLHRKRTDSLAPPSLRVEYLCGFSAFSEYVAFQREGWARTFAENWWFAMGGADPAPDLVSDAIARSGELGRVTEIAVHREGQWWRVAERRLENGDEIDRHYRLSPPGSRQAAREAMQRQPFNDEVPY
jgi:DNA repair protein RadD